MSPPPDPAPDLDDPALAGGEWLFRRDGEVFGPLDSRALAAMLYRGELAGTTVVSSGDGRWRPVAEVPAFKLHARKAEAALRVEAEVTGARLLRRRRRRRGAILVLALSAALVAGAGLAAQLLSPTRGRVSPLLEDFGQGIRIASARVVAGGARRAESGEVEVALDPRGPAPARRPERPERQERAAARPAARPAAQAAAPAAPAEGELVATQFDAGKIQAVVNREQRSLVPCFRDEAARAGDFRGQVPLEFAIGNDGRVAALWIDEPRLRDGPLRECLLHALAAWRFDPFPGQRPTVQLAFSIGR
jgi:hypothetical protein